ncbi:efflux RND transporter periplasmic adaptor subunit [Solemya velesiana gill symbiont]|uniref:Efflux transporter periplasmic adaptor subunit n=1 Tax=Solemya velesiana gill symbiont TaxID=1918948 RepID=A0A1T2KSJ1_9GAMM|nr:efflux RND transporter periplasmic adaptor subunit [Solemya velesiana gill symbiont]OOZ35670.1 efflux transporter periplasmic adaptor subunit [Solemya velesiana gill symbiont]
MITRHTRLIISLLALATAAAGIWYINRPKPIELAVDTAEPGLVEETVANTRAGTVKACRRAKLSPGIGGQIAVLEIKEGDKVRSGTLLLSLWNKDLMSEITLTQAEAAAAEASARSACLQAQVARREANRVGRLRKSGAVSIDTVDKAETEAQAMQASCESANASARVATARVEVIRSQLERTQLIAPFDGIVAEINGELNEYVTPSPPGIVTPPAVDLIDNTCFYVAAPIDEVDAPKITVEQTARVSLDAFDDRRFPGTVRRIAPYVLDLEKQARTVNVEVEFTNPEDIKSLLAGYSADVEIILDMRKQALRIPTEAVLEDDHIYLLLEDEGILEKRKIETGMSNWDHTEVTDGLKAGDLVVTSVDRDGVEDGALATREKDKKP